MTLLTSAPGAVYIHIPFCTNKCHYCDFNSYVLKGQPVMDYLDALEREMQDTVKRFPPNTVETVFVGGGTPTVLLPDQMEKFLKLVNAYFPKQAADMEFTMEANPGTTDEDKLAVMKAGGVNRISFGVQSFEPDLLTRIGRIHSVDDVYRSIEAAQKTGFTNLSIDLMFGLPKQTIAMMQRTLDAALALDLRHYSIYSLKVEENTLFHTLYERNQLPLPDEDEEASMFTAIMERLNREGYRQYEISNFAKPGFESRHNNTYWRNKPYYGLGAGAHGYNAGRRHVNVKGIAEYIEATRNGLPLLEEFAVPREEAMEDFMMVGLRLLDGVNDADFRAQFGTGLEEVFAPVIGRLLQQELLERTEGGLKLSQRGIMLGNEVFGAFIGFFS
jgi:putative oxygen-independent coproporphyrinogen III oxidase